MLCTMHCDVALLLLSKRSLRRDEQEPSKPNKPQAGEAE
jgi:hypothetical protein